MVKKPKFIIFLLLSFVLPAPATLAYDVEAAGGYERLLHSDLLGESAGKGTRYDVTSSLRLMQFVRIGLLGSYSIFTIDAEESQTNSTTTVEGSYTSTRYGPFYAVEIPAGYFGFQVFSSYLLGTNEYEVESKGTQTINDTNFESTQKTTLSMPTQGVDIGAKLRIGGAYGLTIAYVESYQVMTVDSANVTYNSSVDGVSEDTDGSSTTGDELEQSLENSKLDHSTRTILFGINYRF